MSYLNNDVENNVAWCIVCGNETYAGVIFQKCILHGTCLWAKAKKKINFLYSSCQSENSQNQIFQYGDVAVLGRIEKCHSTVENN